MKILVTGGAGFIGSHIVDALIGEGHEVGVVDNLLTGKVENINPEAKFYRFDICDSCLSVLMQEQRYEYVIHHAAQINVAHSVGAPMEDARVNVMGTLNLLECSRKCGTRGIIFASSGGAIYGDAGQKPVGEKHDKQALSPYGVGKLASEYYLCCLSALWQLPYIALRYGNVYGPRQDAEGESGVIALFARQLLLERAPVIFGDGEQTRDYVYVEDVVRANLLALHMIERQREGKFKAPIGIDSRAFNIASGQGTSVNELYNLLKVSASYTGSVQFKPSRPGEIQDICLDCRRARRVLGWEPEVNLSEGLGRTLSDSKKRLLSQHAR